MDYYIGIDGGGTKTAAVLANVEGEVIAGALAGATNPNSATDDQIKQELKSITEQLQQQYERAFNYPMILLLGCLVRQVKTHRKGFNVYFRRFS